MRSNQVEDIQVKHNELESELLPKDLSIHLVKDRWQWTYRCLASEDFSEQDFDNPVDALCDFIGLILKQQEKNENRSFRKLTEEYRDALEETLEDEPYDDGVMVTLTSISVLLDNTIQDL